MVVAADDSRPSHMTALRNRRFVEGSTRRYIDAAVSGAPHPYGSSTATITNSAPSGTSMPTRMRPLFSSIEKAALRFGSVETSAPAQLDPSFVLKIGSSPRDSWNRRRTESGVIVQPCAGRCHVEQLRPLVPSGLKNGLFRSI